MTVSTEITRNVHQGNGSTVTFPFAFKILQEADLVVTYFGPTYASAGEVQVLDTAYTVDNFGDSGGEVTLVATLTSDDRVELKRELTYTQLVDFVQNATFDAQVMEDLADRLVMLSQQAKTEAEIGVKMSGAADEDTEYLMPPPEDGKFPVGNASNGWDNKEIGDLSATAVTLPVSIAEGGTGGTTAALARTNLLLGSSAVLDTGTAAGELPKNSDLGNASTKDAGSGAGEVVLIDGSSRLPAIPARNLKEVRGFQLLDEQEVDAAAGTATSYDFTSLGTFDQFLIELLHIGVETDNAEVVIEAYDGATLYGVGGTTGKFSFVNTWRRTGPSVTSNNTVGGDYFQVSPEGWLFDSDTGGHESSFSTSILVTNNATKFSALAAHNQYPKFNAISGSGLYGTATPGEMSPTCLTATMLDAVDLDGFRIRIEHGATAYFNEGLIRIWGLTGGLWTSGSERPILI